MSADGAHPPGCACVRCRGFERGNSVAVRHGAYTTQPDVAAVVRFGDYVLTVAAQVREHLAVDGLYSPAFELTIESLAIAIWRRNVAATALDDAPASERPKLERDLRGWLSSADRLAAALGMTPASRARLGLDVAQTQSALAAAKRRAELLTKGGRLVDARHAEDEGLSDV